MHVRVGMRADEPLPADRAHSALDGSDRLQAVLTYRQPRNIGEWIPANAAVGRKEGGEETFRQPGRTRRKVRLSWYGSGSYGPSSVPGTAEDTLPPPKKDLGSCLDGTFSV
jgi:hypothetical protein